MMSAAGAGQHIGDAARYRTVRSTRLRAKLPFASLADTTSSSFGRTHLVSPAMAAAAAIAGHFVDVRTFG